MRGTEAPEFHPAAFIPGRRLRRAVSYVRYDFPPQLTANSSQSTRIPIPKNSEVFWLECDDKIVVVAPDGHSPPRCTLERAVDLVCNQ